MIMVTGYAIGKRQSVEDKFAFERGPYKTLESVLQELGGDDDVIVELYDDGTMQIVKEWKVTTGQPSGWLDAK